MVSVVLVSRFFFFFFFFASYDGGCWLPVGFGFGCGVVWWVVIFVVVGEEKKRIGEKRKMSIFIILLGSLFLYIKRIQKVNYDFKKCQKNP